MSGETLIVMLPVIAEANPHCWRVKDDSVVGAGALSLLLEEPERPGFEKVIALAPMSAVRLVWTSLPDLEPRQAETVARLQLQEQAIGDVHAVARCNDDGEIVAAVIDGAVFAQALFQLQAAGLDPDHVVPAALIIDPPEDSLLRADIGGDAFLRGSRLAIPDEPALAPLLAADLPVIGLDDAAVNEAIARAATAEPALDLRQGIYAKRKPRMIVSEDMRRYMLLLTGAILLTTLVLALVTWAKYEAAISRENERAIAAARKVDPSIADIATAEERVDRTLRSSGRAQGDFTQISSIVWRSVRDAPNVALTELRYDESGIVTTVLSAPEANSINAALLAIQRAGYRITATPRTNASGATLVDLTVRTP